MLFPFRKRFGHPAASKGHETLLPLAGIRPSLSIPFFAPASPRHGSDYTYPFESPGRNSRIETGLAAEREGFESDHRMAEHILILIVAFTLMFIGLLGSVLPGLPGAPLILAGALIYGWYTGFATVTWSVLLVLLFLTLFSYLLEFFASVLGLRKWGQRLGNGRGFAGPDRRIAFGASSACSSSFCGSLPFELAKRRTFRHPSRAVSEPWWVFWPERSES